MSILGSWFSQISLAQLEKFCSRMGTGLKSGVDILKLLDSESKHGTSKHRQALQSVGSQIRSGETLSKALSQANGYFPQLLIRVMSAGEHSGRMDYCFQEMATHYRELVRARAKFLSQVTFPLISLCIAFAVISLLIFVNGFMQAGSINDRPFDLTGIGLRGISGVLTFWFVCFLIASVLGVIAFGIRGNWFQCHKTLVPLARNIPVIGPVFTTLAMSRLSMTLSMMLGAGVDARRSVRESLLATGNHYYMAGIPETEKAIERGKSFAEALDTSKRLPQEFIQAVEVGELSGTDSESLERLASVYRERSVAALTTLSVVAGVVVWLMIAILMIMAIFSIFFQIMGVYNDALNFR
jgi:type IV pilus assembly protein PilC